MYTLRCSSLEAPYWIMGWHSSGCKLSRELKLWRERLNHCRMRMAKTVSNMGSPFPSSRHNPNLSWLRVKTECIQTIHHAPSIQEIEGNSWSFYHQMYHDGKKPVSIFEFSIEARSILLRPHRKLESKSQNVGFFSVQAKVSSFHSLWPI